MEKKIAVVLSGCGVYDGAEIHEATLSLYAIMKFGATYEIFAPDIPQHHVINHLNGEEMDESRNVLIESARIARGNIKPLSGFDASQYDGILFPGGFGAAKNLSSYAFKGSEMEVNEEVVAAIRKMVDQEKPVGALCISPVILAKMLDGVELTIGQDAGTATHVGELGAVHKSTNHGEVVVDTRYKVVTSPCYMLDANILQIAAGAENVVQQMLAMMR